MAAAVDGWFRHDWFESSYFAPVWFAPADESGLEDQLQPMFYGGRGGRPLLRYDSSQDDMLRRVRDWYDWIEKRNAKPEPAVEAVEPEPAQEAQVVEPPPAPLRDVSLQYPNRPQPQPPVATPEPAAPAAPQTAMASDPSDDFDYAALMATIEKEVAFVDASMAEFQL